MNLDKRISYIIATGLYILLLGILYVGGIAVYPGAVVGIFGLFSAAAYFISFKRLRKTKYLLLLAFITFSFPYFFPSLNLTFVILYIVMVAFGFYLNLLALNIYNISEKNNKALPLLQAAKLLVFIGLVLVVFLGSTMTYKIYFEYLGSLGSLLAQLSVFLVFYLFLFNSIAEWFFYEDEIGELKARNMLVSIGSLKAFATLYMSQLSLVLMFTRLEDFGRGLFLAANMYVLISFIQVAINKTLNKRFFIESISILLVIYLIIYYL